MLLQKCDKDIYYSLLGGKVKMFEDTKLAAKREVLEELGIEISIEDLKSVGIYENFFVYKETNIHELLYVYVVNSKTNYKKIDCYDLKCLDKENVYFKWIDFEKLKSIDLRPKYVLNQLIDEKLSHIIIHE